MLLTTCTLRDCGKATKRYLLLAKLLQAQGDAGLQHYMYILKEPLALRKG